MICTIDEIPRALAALAKSAADGVATAHGNPYAGPRYAERALIAALAQVTADPARAKLLRALDEVILCDADPSGAADWWDAVVEAAEEARDAAVVEAAA